jgi:hypothetical protein
MHLPMVKHNCLTGMMLPIQVASTGTQYSYLLALHFLGVQEVALQALAALALVQTKIPRHARHYLNMHLVRTFPPEHIFGM